ncbi:GAF domain-containing protein, partial [Nonomuraea aridisoli]
PPPEIADGDGAPALLGTAVPVQDSLAGAVFTHGEPMSDPDMQSAPYPDSPLRRLGYGPGLMVPLGAVPAVHGVLALAKRSGRLPFSAADRQMLHAFAGQAAIALELAETRRAAERLGLLEDRDRIAKDLHDVVIQLTLTVSGDGAVPGGARLRWHVPLPADPTAYGDRES